MTDTNKAVQSLALDIVARIATGMGKPFEKHSRLFVLPITTVLSDQKAPIRSSALQTLTAMATACDGLDSMISGLGGGLETTNPVQKCTLLGWIAEWFKEHEPGPHLDLSNWAASIVSSLDDRNGDVRKAAQGMLPPLIACAGYDFVMHQTNSLKPASRNTAVPLIQAAAAAAPQTQPAKSSARAVTLSEKQPLPASAMPESSIGASAPAVAMPKATGVRRKLPLGSNRPDSRNEMTADGGPRSMKPTSATTQRAAPTAHASSAPSTLTQSLCFIGNNNDARKSRVAKDSSRWVNDGGTTRKDLADFLQTQMEPQASKELISQLFSHDHNAVNDQIAGLTAIHELYHSTQESDETIVAVCLANFDLPLKYFSLKAHEPQPNLLSKGLDVVEAVLAFLRSISYQMTDLEALCFVPTVISKVRHHYSS